MNGCEVCSNKETVYCGEYILCSGCLHKWERYKKALEELRSAWHGVSSFPKKHV